MATFTRFSEWLDGRKDEAMATGKMGAKTVYPITFVRGEGGIGIALKYRDESGAEGKSTGIKSEKAFRSLSAKDGEHNIWGMQTHDGQTYQVKMTDDEVGKFEGMFKSALAKVGAGAKAAAPATMPAMKSPAATADPEPPKGHDPDTGQVTNEKEYTAWKIWKAKEAKAAAAARAAEPSYTPRHGLGLQGDELKANQDLQAAVFAVKDFVVAADKKYPDIDPQRILGHPKFKELLDAIPGYDDTSKARLTKAMLEKIQQLRMGRPASAPTATPAAAAPPAAKKKSGFMSWLTGRES